MKKDFFIIDKDGSLTKPEDVIYVNVQEEGLCEKFVHNIIFKTPELTEEQKKDYEVRINDLMRGGGRVILSTCFDEDEEYISNKTNETT